jgi:hypothetical protein
LTPEDAVKTRRLVIAGVALAASLGLATAGCGGSGDSGGTATSRTHAIAADPKQALADSVKGLADGNFKFTLADHEATGSGSVHQPSKSAKLEMTLKTEDVKGRIGFIIINQDTWVKFDFGSEMNALMELPDKWMHVDPAKVKDAEFLEEMSIKFGDAEDVDPANSTAIFKALVTAERISEGKYSGTVDLTKATDSELVDEDVLKDLGDKAKAIPFTASLDAQGRLTQVVLDIPAAGKVKAHKVEVAYSDYGAAAPVEEPPAGDRQEAPASMYEMLNG